MSKQKEKGLKAGYTVEASILMSLVMFVLAALLAASFYLHDRAVLQAASCEAASAGSNTATRREEARVTSELKGRMTARRLMGSRNLAGQADCGEKEVQVSWSGSYPVPGFAADYFFSGKLPIQVSWSSKRIRPAGTIRKIRGIKKLAGGGAG